jgi:hypothetical protein
MKKQREDERMRRRCIQLAGYEAENDQGEDKGRANAGFYVDWSDSDNGRGGKTSSESDDGGAGRNLYD